MSRDDAVCYINGLAEMLQTFPRQGAEKDAPEGSRYLRISDTLAVEMGGKLKQAAKSLYGAGAAGAR